MSVRRSVGRWSIGALLALGATRAAAQSSASFPDDPPSSPPPLAPAPAAPPPAAPPPAAPPPSAPAAPAATPTPPPFSADALRGPPVVTTAPSNDLRLPVVATPVAVPPHASSPPMLPYRNGMPVPDGYSVVDRPASGLLAAGLVGLGVSYAAGVIIAASQGFENGTALLAIPVFGPYAAVGTREYECSVNTVAAAKRCTVGEVQIVTLIAVDGLAQTAGALVAIAGLVSGRQELVRSDLVGLGFAPPVGARKDWRLSFRGSF